MAKKDIWRHKIVDILQKKSLNYGELCKEARKEVKIEVGQVGARPLKKFNEAFMKLLKKHIIQINGYDFSVYSVDRIQSFKDEGLMVSLVKTQLFEIYPLIARLDSANVENVKSAYDELINIFIKKIREYEDLQLGKWEKLEAKVKIRPIKEFYIEFKEKNIEETDNGFVKFINENYAPILSVAKVTQENNENKYEFISIERVENYIRKIHRSESFERYSERTEQLFNERIVRRYSVITRQLLCKKIIPEILNEYDNAQIMRFSDFDLELPNIDFNQQQYFHLTYMLGGIIDLKGNITPSDFLSLFNIEKPESMSEDSINSLFHPIIFEVFTKKESEFLKFGLANALSDSEESLKWLEYFILEIGFKFSIREDKLFSTLKGPSRMRISDPWL